MPNSFYEKKFGAKIDLILHTKKMTGGVRIGNKAFALSITNGSIRNTDTTMIFVIDTPAKMHTMHTDFCYTFFAWVHGKFNIYIADYNSDIVETLNGDYGIFIDNGIVIFQRWENT